MSKNLIIANMLSFTCAVSAIYMACNQIEGWGWFLTVAVLTFTLPKTNKGGD